MSAPPEVNDGFEGDCEAPAFPDDYFSDDHDGGALSSEGDFEDMATAAGEVVIQSSTSEQSEQSEHDREVEYEGPPAKKPRASANAPRRHGPRSLLGGPTRVDDALRWPEMFKRVAGDTRPGQACSIWKRFAELVSEVGVETSSDFSGCG
eukprot:2098396-Pyramimonas_sp.AAC.1